MEKIAAFKTVGDCMRPWLKDGDIAFVRKDVRLSVGDGVCFMKGGRRFLHRALVVSSGGVIAADDTARTPPVFVANEEIIGSCSLFPSGMGGVLYNLCSRGLFTLWRAIRDFVKTPF